MTPPDSLSDLLERAKARVDAMSPEEYAAMIQAQRESWARGMAPCEHGVSDWEDCDQCRGQSLIAKGEAK